MTVDLPGSWKVKGSIETATRGDWSASRTRGALAGVGRLVEFDYSADRRARARRGGYLRAQRLELGTQFRKQRQLDFNRRELVVEELAEVRTGLFATVAAKPAASQSPRNSGLTSG